MFCGYCGIAQRTDNLEDHCLKAHKDKEWALKASETPLSPKYSNWKEHIAEYPAIEPIKALNPIIGKKAKKHLSLFPKNPQVMKFNE